MENKGRIYIGGTFDLFHSGHIELLKNARYQGYEVVVSLNTDEFAEQYKRKPIMPLNERMAVLLACRYVDYVIVNTGGKDSKPSILESGAKFILHGDDWTGVDLMKQMGFDQEWLDKHGIEMIYSGYTSGVSTTELLKGFDYE